jgi:hypothetical protein
MGRSNDTKTELLEEIKNTKKDIKRCDSLNWKLAKNAWEVYLKLLTDRLKEGEYN